MNNEPPEQMIGLAVAAANASPCQKSKRGAAIWSPWKPGRHIVVGYNRLVGGACTGSDLCRTWCGRSCIHAEQDALLSLDRDRAGPLSFEMLHVKVVDGQAVEGGPPSCLECSKLIVEADVGVMWLLETGKGWVRRSASDFHRETLANVRDKERH